MGRRLKWIGLAAVFAGLALTIALTGLTPAPVASSSAEPLATAVAWIPLVRHDPTPTPVPTPVLPPSPRAARLLITPSGGINASTFNADSFILRNEATDSARITAVRIDLSTAVFPDMVFDPYGQGGDTIAKDLRVDHKGGADFRGHRYEGEHGGGFDVLVLDFAGFDPGEEFRFSVDVDPNSIRGVGAPGPNEAGSVSGVELIGSTVAATYEDGVTLSSQTFLLPGSDSGSLALLREGLPPAPQLSIPGLEPFPATINFNDPRVTIAGPAWQPVRVLVLEGGLFLDGVPGGGYEVQPYDANSVVAIRAFDSQTQHDGRAVLPVLLSRSQPHAGINHVVGAFDNHFGMWGAPGMPLKIEFIP